MIIQKNKRKKKNAVNSDGEPKSVYFNEKYWKKKFDL